MYSMTEKTFLSFMTQKFIFRIPKVLNSSQKFRFFCCFFGSLTVNSLTAGRFCLRIQSLTKYYEGHNIMTGGAFFAGWDGSPKGWI